MRKLIVTCFAVLLLVTMLMGCVTLASMVKEEATAAPYYKNIRIRKGDSLWKIADQCKEGNSMNTHEYMDHLIQIDNLKRDTIHAGQYLMMMYPE